MTDVQTEPNVDAPRMSFGDHLEELRRRLIWSCLAVLATTSVCFYYQKHLLLFVTRPHRLTMQALGHPVQLQVFDYADRFMIPMKIALICGLLAASPIVLYQMWRFIGAGLYPSEKKYVLLFVPISLVLFLAGAAFGYFALIPVTLKFLASFGDEWNLLKTDIAFDKYLDLFFAMTVAAGAIFEIPLVMLFLSWSGLVHYKTYISWRRAEIIVAAVLGAILTPGGDLVSMASLAVPIALLYEVGIVAGWAVSRKTVTA